MLASIFTIFAKKIRSISRQSDLARAKDGGPVHHSDGYPSYCINNIKSYTVFLNVFACILYVSPSMGVRFNGDWSARGLTFYVANRKR